MKALLFVLAAAPVGACAQSVVFTFNDNTALTVPVVDVRSVTFVDNALQPNLWNGSQLNDVHGFSGNNPSMSIGARSEAPATPTVFPLPATDQVVVRWEALDTAPFQWQLMDATGRTVRPGTEQWAQRGQQTLRLERAGLPDGCYTLCIRQGANHHITRVQWQH